VGVGASSGSGHRWGDHDAGFSPGGEDASSLPPPPPNGSHVLDVVAFATACCAAAMTVVDGTSSGFRWVLAVVGILLRPSLGGVGIVLCSTLGRCSVLGRGAGLVASFLIGGLVQSLCGSAWRVVFRSGGVVRSAQR
jgi:hypothetical protein